jgi:class 3 adenylate cyclase
MGSTRTQTPVSTVRSLNLEVRSGIHAGEIEVEGEDIAGLPSISPLGVAANANANEVLVSNTVRDLVAGSNLRFKDRGAQSLKGIEEPIRLFSASTVTG